MKSTCLKFWIMPIGGYDTSQAVGKEIQHFEKDHPDITIDLSIIPWSQAWKRIIAAAKSKQLPDIFQIGNTWTKTLMAIGALTDVTEEADRDELKDKFHPIFWDTCKVKNLNNIYAIPWFGDARMIFYRKDIFKKVGLCADDLNNWEAFEESCRLLSRFDGTVGALGVADIKDAGLVHDIAPWIWGAGGDFVSLDGDTAAFQEENSLKGMKFYFDLIDKGYAPISDRTMPGYSAYDFFISGKYAMFVTGSHVASHFLPGFFGTTDSKDAHKVKERFGIVLHPAGPAGRFSFLGGSNLAISNYSPNKHEAWEFLRFLISKEFQMRQYNIIGILPAGIEPLVASFHQYPEEEKVLTEIYRKIGRTYKQIDLWASVEFILVEFLGRVIDSLKNRAYGENFLVAETKKFAEQINYILSL